MRPDQPKAYEFPTLHEAEQRYLHDAEFHARVHQAVTTLRLYLHGRSTGRLSEREVDIATRAAAMGLLMSEFEWVSAPGGPSLSPTADGAAARDSESGGR